MPEHRDTTPAPLRLLESFLWHDFDDGLPDWREWLARKLPEIPATGAQAGFDRAMQLHAALRVLEAANNGLLAGAEAEAGQLASTEAHAALDQLIAACHIRPRFSAAGGLTLGSDTADPVSRLLLIVLEALQSGLWRRFKLCRDPGCRASYYDASKPAAKTWCSMDTCGSRNKMRRFRARG